MIHHAVGLISSRLNQHLKVRLNSPDDLVALTSLTDHEGKPAAAARNRLVLFVTDIAEESTARGIRASGSRDGRVAVSPDPVHLNVFFMTCANFDPDKIKVLGDIHVPILAAILRKHSQHTISENV